MFLLFYLHYVVVPFYFTVRNTKWTYGTNKLVTSCSCAILFGFLTENILWQLLMCFLVDPGSARFGSCFRPSQITFWVAVSRYLPSSLLLLEITLATFHLDHITFVIPSSMAAVISFIIVFPLDSYYIYWMHWGTEWFHMVHFSRWFEMDRTSYMSRKAEFLKDVFCSIRMVPFQYVLYAVY